GMTVQEITPEIAEHLGLADAAGVVISQVASGSPAAEAGIQAGDVVRQVNRSRISSLEEYRSVMSRAISGDSVLVLIQRGESKFFAVIRK
ncbi:MAG: PDZ domain-containing protein, partial [Deltaproteobacteria bacterium]|nr:PDZ domain-containing protein [Deltaproteobacteria bacterium]